MISYDILNFIIFLFFQTVMEQFDNYLSHLQPMQDSTEEILNKFSGFRQHLDSILIKHRNTVQESMLDTKKDVKHMEILLTRQIAEVVRTEVSTLLLTIAVKYYRSLFIFQETTLSI